MDWIVDHFQIVIAIVGGVVYFWNQFRQAKNEEREATRRHEEEMAEGYGPDPYEEPVATYETVSPPQLPPRLPSRRDFPAAEPVAEPVQNRSVLANQRELERQANLQERLRVLRATKVKTTGGASATQAQRKPVLKPVVVRGTGLRERLRNRKEIRQAIIMREILGPPVGLK